MDWYDEKEAQEWVFEMTHLDDPEVRYRFDRRLALRLMRGESGLVNRGVLFFWDRKAKTWAIGISPAGFGPEDREPEVSFAMYRRFSTSAGEHEPVRARLQEWKEVE